jgi:hypothetical protein
MLDISTPEEVLERRPEVVSLLVRNLSTLVSTAALKVAFPAFLRQANNDLHLWWTLAEGAYVPYISDIGEISRTKRWPVSVKNDVWRATIYDWPSQASADPRAQGMPVNALSAVGYHYVDSGVPHLVVFAGTMLAAGVSWTVPLSHELCEALVDPEGTATIPVKGEIYELEVCDPVQYLVYPIDEIGGTTWVSDFITPKWFQEPVEWECMKEIVYPYDFANQLVAPRQRWVGGERTIRKNGQDRTETLTTLGSTVAVA